MKKTIIGVALVILVVLLSVSVVKANPIFAPITVQTATATTTVVAMTAGTATTTLTLDTYSSGNPRLATRAALLIQFAGSATSILNTYIQYSQDGVDWYQDAGSYAARYSTTTKPFDLTTVNYFSYNYTSQPATFAAGTSATSTRSVQVDTPTRYVRAVFVLPAGSASGSLWAQFVPVKEVAE